MFNVVMAVEEEIAVIVLWLMFWCMALVWLLILMLPRYRK